MRVQFPGLLIERLPSGANRYRVRVEGDKAKRIVMPVPPDHADFSRHYHAARCGDVLDAKAVTRATPRSIRWLVDRYLAHLKNRADAGLASPATYRQRSSLLLRLCAFKDPDGDCYGVSDIDAPTSAFVAVRDAWMKTPAEADNLIKAARALYVWGIETGATDRNPIVGIKKIHKSKGGAIPWTAADLKQFRDRHQIGTAPYLWLTLCMFTACRLGDARVLGAQHQVQIDGVTWLQWQPGKKGSAPVQMPMMPPLQRAVAAMAVQGPCYLLTDRGKQHASVNSLGNWVRRWCLQAGLADRSSHGVRKATAELLAEWGCSNNQIMAILAHTKGATSEIYTKGAQRKILSQDAMQAMAKIPW